MRLTLKYIHDRIGIAPDTPGYGTAFGNRSRIALTAAMTNTNAPAITHADMVQAAERLGVSVSIIKAVRKVEAPRGPFDDEGRPSILYERHVFARNCEPVGRFTKLYPKLSGGPYGKGGYGTYGAQFDKFLDACALDIDAAFRACSWGAFQVLGENAEMCGYADPFDMARALVESEAGHLDSFVRFVEALNLQDELQACCPGDPESCIPFVSKYNGSGFRQFDYHTKLAKAAL